MPSAIPPGGQPPDVEFDNDHALADFPPEPITLQSVVDGNRLPSWFESAALARAVISATIARDDPDCVPSPADVRILPTGGVAVTGGSVSTDGPVAGMAELLQPLFSGRDVPPMLVGVLERARTAASPYDSLHDLDRALSYFTRPDITPELEEVFRRGDQSLVQTTHPIVQARVAAPPEPLRELQISLAANAPSPRRSRSDRVVAVGGAVAVVLLASTALWAWTSSAIVLPAVSAPPVAMAAIRVPVNPFTIKPPVVRLRATRVSALVSTARALAASSAAIPFAEAGAPSAAQPADKVAPGPPLPAPPPPNATPAVAIAFDTTVYSQADAEVTPPEPIRRQLPLHPLGGLADNDGTPGALELLVLEDGTVGEVRLVNSARRIHDRLLLSAAKTWRFSPALRDGHPVRFLLHVPITW